MAQPGERSFAGILQDIVASVREIVGLEITLAKLEVRESVSAMRRGIVIVTAGGVALVFSLAFVLLASVYLLSTVMAPWYAALTVAGAAAVLGAVCLVVGVRQLRQVHLPTRTIHSLQESPWPTTSVR